MAIRTEWSGAADMRIRQAKDGERDVFDVDARLPGRRDAAKIRVLPGQWGWLQIDTDAATQQSYRVRVVEKNKQIRVSYEVTLAVAGGFRHWIADDEPWRGDRNVWSSLNGGAPLRPAPAGFSGAKEVRLSRGIPQDGPNTKTVTITDKVDPQRFKKSPRCALRAQVLAQTGWL